MVFSPYFPIKIMLLGSINENRLWRFSVTPWDLNQDEKSNFAGL
jgi:hypothetical protein